MKRTLIFALALCLLWAGSVWGANVTQLSELRQDVKNQFLVTTDALHPDSVIDDYINQACRDLAGYGIIHQVDSIVWVASTRYYTLPTDFLSFNPPEDAGYPDGITGERAFDFISPSDVGKIGASAQASAPEYVWFTEKDNVRDTARIWFYPPPTAVDTIILVYTAEAVELSGANDTTNIPYEYRPLIVYYAVALCFAKDQEFNKASWWFALYDQTLNKKLMFDKQKRYDYIIKPKVIE